MTTQEIVIQFLLDQTQARLSSCASTSAVSVSDLTTALCEGNEDGDETSDETDDAYLERYQAEECEVRKALLALEQERLAQYYGNDLWAAARLRGVSDSILPIESWNTESGVASSKSARIPTDPKAATMDSYGNKTTSKPEDFI